MNAKVRFLIADHLAVPLGAVRDDAHLARDLGADSLDLVELSMRLEEALGILIADEESEACATVGDAIDLVERKLARKKAAQLTS
jgi:acyl carrier protein